MSIREYAQQCEHAILTQHPQLKTISTQSHRLDTDKWIADQVLVFGERLKIASIPPQQKKKIMPRYQHTIPPFSCTRQTK